jgi:hypothetical protein
VKGPGPVRVVAVLASFVAFVFAIFLWQPVWLFHWRDYRVGNDIIARVDAFRRAHGDLPDTLEDVGVNGDLRVYYCKVSDDELGFFEGEFVRALRLNAS